MNSRMNKLDLEKKKFSSTNPDVETGCLTSQTEEQASLQLILGFSEGV